MGHTKEFKTNTSGFNYKVGSILRNSEDIIFVMNIVVSDRIEVEWIKFRNKRFVL